MYTDPVQVITWYGTGATAAVEVEATEDILFHGGRLADAGTASTALLDSETFPNGGSVEAFGVIITEAITNTNSTLCVLDLNQVDPFGSTATLVCRMSIPNADQFTVGNTANTYDPTTGIVGSNVRPTGVTATVAKQAGSRIIHPGFKGTDFSVKVLPFKLNPGARIYAEVSTKSGASGGAFNVFAIVRHNSSIFPTQTSLGGTATQSAVTLARIAS